METNERTEMVAAACHSAWYAYAVVARGELGDTWDKAPEWQRESIRDGVRFCDAWIARTERELQETRIQGNLWPVCLGLARLRLPEESHRNWMERKLGEGWTYGPSKDPTHKKHPSLVPFQEMDESERLKDLVFIETYLAIRYATHGFERTDHKDSTLSQTSER